MNPFQAGTRFRAELRRGAGFAAGFDVPDDVLIQLGGGAPRVLATVNGHRFRGTILRTPRGNWLRVSFWHRAAARLTAARHYDVDVEPDVVHQRAMLPS